MTDTPLTREQVEELMCQTVGPQSDDTERACTLILAQDAALREQLAAAVKERDEAITTRTGYDKWLKGGVYFTMDEFDAHESNHRNDITKLQQQLATAQEGERLWKGEVKRIKERICEAAGIGLDYGYATAIGVIKGRLAQAQARAEAAEHAWCEKWDAHDHYPKGYVTAQITLRENLQREVQGLKEALTAFGIGK